MVGLDRARRFVPDCHQQSPPTTATATATATNHRHQSPPPLPITATTTTSLAGEDPPEKALGGGDATGEEDPWDLVLDFAKAREVIVQVVTWSRGGAEVGGGTATLRDDKAEGGHVKLGELELGELPGFEGPPVAELDVDTRQRQDRVRF